MTRLRKSSSRHSSTPVDPITTMLADKASSNECPMATPAGTVRRLLPERLLPPPLRLSLRSALR
jgi:hypothetical protein